MRISQRTIWKMFILIVLTFGISSITASFFQATFGGPPTYKGIPLLFYRLAGCAAGPGIQSCVPFEINYLNLLLNIIYWGVISFIIVSLINKINNKTWLKGGISASLSFLSIFLTAIITVIISGRIPFQGSADGFLLNLFYLAGVPSIVLFILGSFIGWIIGKIRR